MREGLLRLQPRPRAVPLFLLRRGVRLPGPKGPLKELLLYGPSFRHGVRDAVVHLLKHPRHGDHDRRPHLLEVLAHGLHALGIADGGACRKHGGVSGRPLEGVREGQKREMVVFFPDGEALEGRFDVRAKVAIGELYALRLPGRAAGVDQGARIVGGDLVGHRGKLILLLGPVVAPVFQRLIPVRHVRGRIIRHGVHDDHGLQRRTLVDDLLNLLALNGDRHDTSLCARIAQDVRDFRRGQRGVNRHVHAAHQLRAQIRDGPLRPVLRQQGHPIALPHTVLVQRPRQRLHPVLQLLPGNVVPSLSALLIAKNRPLSAAVACTQPSEKLRNGVEFNLRGHGSGLAQLNQEISQIPSRCLSRVLQRQLGRFPL